MMRIDFDFRAQSRDASIITSVIDHNVVPPHSIEDLVSRERATGTFGKEFKEPKLLSRESDLFAVPEQFMRHAIQFAVSKLKHSQCGSFTSAQECLRAGQQFAN